MTLTDIIAVTRTILDVADFYLFHFLPDCGDFESKPYLSWANEDIQKSLPSDFDKVLRDHSSYPPSQRLNNLAQRDRRGGSNILELVNYFSQYNNYKRLYDESKKSAQLPNNTQPAL